jgi:uroporphyrinogen decarboxylase
MGSKFDFAHFWEDICFKNGPLVIPAIFKEKVGPHYKRITNLVKKYGIKIISLDCDGLIDSLIPVWFDNGVNTMFPIEVGTWNANIKPWREKYGKELRGVGGMNKTVFSRDYSAIDAEIERLKPIVELGGYIPCPDHRIAPDAKWYNVRYYCDKMRQVFGNK